MPASSDSEMLLSPITLVVGDEELLVSRASAAVVAAARAADPDVDVRDVTALELAAGDLDQMLSPSLFGERRVLIIRDAQELTKDVATELTAYAADPLPEVSLVVLHTGGQKGKALLAGFGQARRVDAARITKPAERRDLVRRELRADGRTVEEEAVGLLVEAVGNDLRELCSAASQLLSDTEGPITADVVTRYHRGRPETSGFTVAERAVDGDLRGALEMLRWGRSAGLHPVLVTSALASTLRTMALVAPHRGTPAGVVAGQLGMPPWKVEKARRQVLGWLPDGLAAALRAVAEADAGVKGAAADKEYVVERALLSVADARGGAR
ncbi:MAG TPA: DNA polymerase III subunit delta [Mycobacteriales bacterium]|nr:DNA polymerase III subunit delta [Mycobacteriales bacterium]